SSTREMTEAEINERFAKQDNTVLFRIYRKTDRVLAGRLDIDLPDYEIDTNGSSIGIDINCEYDVYSKIPEQAAAEGIKESEIVLIPPEEFDYRPRITKADKNAAKTIDEVILKYSGYFSRDNLENDMESPANESPDILPALVDHRPRQSSIKDQGRRGTCVAHSALGLLEAHEHIPDDLSEQHAHYKFIEFMQGRHDTNVGIKTIDSARYLAREDGRICEEKDWPYIPFQETINQMVCNGSYCPPSFVEQKAIYGYEANAYKIITDNGLNGESIKNTRYLETLLSQGYDIVIGTWVSWDDRNNDGILEPVLDNNNRPIGMGGHAMLVVGYNRPEQYFIVKNSWGRGWGHDGYGYLHYNLVRSCFKYGYVVDGVLPKSSSVLPGKLTQAPYSSERIYRRNLKATILFMKSSNGHYAISEAYAGNNLLLRNLRVYNLDGSVYLEKDSIVIREGYLFDIHTARETNAEADFWWHSSYPNENFLLARNNALVHIAYDFAGLNVNQVNTGNLVPSTISKSDLNYAVIVGRTTANRRFKMLACIKPNGNLQISYIELFNPDGSRYIYATNLCISPSRSFNLDTLRTDPGPYADIKWNVLSDNNAFLESCSGTQIQLIWCL
ncbi:C1 family peptidase, partial [Candidatus Poribacteria bacterium]|nr:C1 family peptidase [Candidatus Poribacteria bacterium]